MPRAKKQQLLQRADGRYRCKYKGIEFYGYSSDEALAARDEYKRQEAAGQLAAVLPVTLQQYALKWLPLHKGNVSAKCYNDYAKQLEKLLSVCGSRPLSSITVDDAAAVWQLFSGMSASLIHRARMLYISLFDTAIENDLIRKNPFTAKHAQPPKAPAGSHRALNPEEIALIGSTPHRLQPAVMIMLYAGLRRGEVLALDMASVDLLHGLIHVSQAVRFDGNRPVLTDPKTEAGVRSVPVLSPLRPILENRVGLVAEAVHGGLMTDTAFRRAWDSYLHALSLAAGHPVSFRPHDLRHTYCTMLRDAGVDMKQAMIWMGHADEKMILRIYDHVTEKRTQSSVSKLESMLQRGQIGGQNISEIKKAL